MIALNAAQIEGLLSASDLVAAVEEGARLLQAGEAEVPHRIHLHHHDDTFLIMPALAGSVFGTKLVSIHPRNQERGKPVTVGVMMVADAVTGTPLALLNAGILTARRTGAVGALGVKLLTPEDVSSIGVIGCGVQGTWQAISACAVRPVREIFVVGRSESSVARFREVVARHTRDVKITLCADGRELLKKTSVVITATTSVAPVLPDEPALLDGKHFFSVGSFRPSMQELPDAVYRLAGKVAVDSHAAVNEVGDLVNPITKQIIQESDAVFLGELLTGSRRIDVTRTTVFKSVGMAIYDLCVARVLVEEATRRGVGQTIHL